MPYSRSHDFRGGLRYPPPHAILCGGWGILPQDWGNFAPKEVWELGYPPSNILLMPRRLGHPSWWGSSPYCTKMYGGRGILPCFLLIFIGVEFSPPNFEVEKYVFLMQKIFTPAWSSYSWLLLQFYLDDGHRAGDVRVSLCEREPRGGQPGAPLACHYQVLRLTYGGFHFYFHDSL